MLKYFFCFVIFLHQVFALAQQERSDTNQLKSYLKAHLISTEGLFAKDDSFNDLESLNQSIGDSKVVMLGEQDHGDAPTFIAKARLVKYLHENMGFDVIAFESDFFGLNRSWEEAEKQNIAVNDVFRNVFPIWTKCEQTKDVFDYIEDCFNNQNKLIVTGFDCQDHLFYSRNYLVSELETYLVNNNSLFAQTPQYEQFISILKEVIQSDFKKLKKTLKKEGLFFFNQLNAIEKELSLMPKDAAVFWLQTIKSIRGEVKNLQIGDSDDLTSDNDRDAQMAENFLWLMRNKYPDKKIIVWLHSGHAAKNMNLVVKTKSEIINMGRILNDSLRSDLYVLGFTSYTGSTGRLTGHDSQDVYHVKIPSKESIEHFINSFGYEYAFLDFKNIPEKLASFKMKGVSHYEIKADWSNVFDAVFYVKEMYPCDRIKENR